MSLVTRVRGDRGRRFAPVEFQDAVELHYRKSGRHATIIWIPEPVCQWQLRITMRPNDPARRAWQAGDMEEEPFEIFEITHYNEEVGLYQGYELEELGVSGLIEMLEKSDSWSGTGQFDSLEEAMAYQVQQQHDNKKQLERYIRAEVEAAGRSLAHIIREEPYLTVGIDLSSPEGADATESP